MLWYALSTCEMRIYVNNHYGYVPHTVRRNYFSFVRGLQESRYSLNLSLLYKFSFLDNGTLFIFGEMQALTGLV